jgi:hypothetical protein
VLEVSGGLPAAWADSRGWAGGGDGHGSPARRPAGRRPPLAGRLRSAFRPACISGYGGRQPAPRRPAPGGLPRPQAPGPPRQQPAHRRRRRPRLPDRQESRGALRDQGSPRAAAPQPAAAAVEDAVVRGRTRLATRAARPFCGPVCGSCAASVDAPYPSASNAALVLVHAESRYPGGRRPFADLWEAVDRCREYEPRLDLTAPLR